MAWHQSGAKPFLEAMMLPYGTLDMSYMVKDIGEHVC